jgi:hypothetical protein
MTKDILIKKIKTLEEKNQLLLNGFMELWYKQMSQSRWMVKSTAPELTGVSRLSLRKKLDKAEGTTR